MLVEIYTALVYVSSLLMLISFLSVKMKHSLPIASWISVIFLGALAFSSATIETTFCEHISGSWECNTYSVSDVGSIALFGGLTLFMLVYSILAQFVWVGEEITNN